MDWAHCPIDPNQRVGIRSSPISRGENFRLMGIIIIFFRNPKPADLQTRIPCGREGMI